MPNGKHKKKAPVGPNKKQKKQHGQAQATQEINILSWNIKDFSANPNRKNGGLFYEYVTSVALTLASSHLIGLIEIQSFNAEEVGHQVGGRLYSVDSTDWLFQESDQFPQHSEQYLFAWLKTVFANVKFVYTFPGIEFPDVSSRPPLMIKADVAGGKAVPIIIYHANAPADPKCAPGNANLAKIPELGASAAGLVMGDFNVTPSDPKKSPGKDSFDALVKLGYTLRLIATKTSLKEVASLNKAATFADCGASEYDNFFVKMPANVTVMAKVIDTISPAVQGNGQFDKTYAEAFGNVAGDRDTPNSGTTKKFKNIYEAFSDYRRYISDHLPILLTLNY